MTRRVLDVSRLPDYAFGHQGLIWWGTVGFMVIEGSMFVMGLVTYFFLRTRVTEWPPAPWPNPDPTFGTIAVALLLLSAIPNQMAKKAAEHLDVTSVRRLLPILLGIGLVLIVVRAYEFSALGVRWDSTAYGSVVWFVMALHTVHLATDVADTAVLTALAFTSHIEPKRMVDISENALYWYFVILWWMPLYLVIYFGPRWL
jgi:cytochrome c oxidase subunit III